MGRRWPSARRRRSGSIRSCSSTYGRASNMRERGRHTRGPSRPILRPYSSPQGSKTSCITSQSRKQASTWRTASIPGCHSTAAWRSYQKNAMGAFLDNLDKCQYELPFENGTHAHFKYYGEDKFMAWCMHYHGVLRVPSRQEAIRVPLTEPIKGLHMTTSCPAHHIPQTSKLTKADKKSGVAVEWKPDCSRIRTAGIHQFKKLKAWMKCYKDTTAKDTTPKWTLLA